ncbi:MAG: hypothetical protein HC866_24990 [Leptolyngbyaceae cyanobacterium RU_5_1]|nr:hypothetical protein [Leptolyngbyaceae cyanobacterium RU_5_1]
MFERAFTTYTQGWLDAHPGFAWAIGHPFWTLGILLLIVFVFWGLLKAIVRFIEKAWLVILQSPFRLGQWLFKISTQSFKGKSALQPAALETSNTIGSEPGNGVACESISSITLEPTYTHQRLVEILNRLETLKHEQDKLLQEVRAIVSQQGSGLVD